MSSSPPNRSKRTMKRKFSYRVVTPDTRQPRPPRIAKPYSDNVADLSPSFLIKHFLEQQRQYLDRMRQTIHDRQKLLSEYEESYERKMQRVLAPRPSSRPVRKPFLISVRTHHPLKEYSQRPDYQAAAGSTSPADSTTAEAKYQGVKDPMRLPSTREGNSVSMLSPSRKSRIDDWLQNVQFKT